MYALAPSLSTLHSVIQQRVLVFVSFCELLRTYVQIIQHIIFELNSRLKVDPMFESYVEYMNRHGLIDHVNRKSCSSKGKEDFFLSFILN